MIEYRKLKSEGLAFHEIVDKVRKDKAMLLLNKNQHTKFITISLVTWGNRICDIKPLIRPD